MPGGDTQRIAAHDAALQPGTYGTARGLPERLRTQLYAHRPEARRAGEGSCAAADVRGKVERPLPRCGGAVDCGGVRGTCRQPDQRPVPLRSEEHTSELQ